jgi:hypothetical protein
MEEIDIVPLVHSLTPYCQWDYSISDSVLVPGNGEPQQRAAVQRRSGGCSRGLIRLITSIMIKPYLSVAVVAGELSDTAADGADATDDAGAEPDVTVAAAAALPLAVGLAVAVTLALDGGIGQLAS